MVVFFLGGELFDGEFYVEFQGDFMGGVVVVFELVVDDYVYLVMGIVVGFGLG